MAEKLLSNICLKKLLLRQRGEALLGIFFCETDQSVESFWARGQKQGALSMLFFLSLCTANIYDQITMEL